MKKYVGISKLKNKQEQDWLRDGTLATKFNYISILCNIQNNKQNTKKLCILLSLVASKYNTEASL